MQKTVLFFLMLVIIVQPATADFIVRNRSGELLLEDGKTYKANRTWNDVKKRSEGFYAIKEGTVENLKDVTFVGWIFNRTDPHTDVFINCKNLTFIDCKLVNVNLDKSFTSIRSDVKHIWEEENDGAILEITENWDNKTRVWNHEKKDNWLVDTYDTHPSRRYVNTFKRKRN
jgi:hypothetical protein